MELAGGKTASSALRPGARAVPRTASAVGHWPFAVLDGELGFNPLDFSVFPVLS